MKIDDLMFRMRAMASQAAIESGEEPPEAPPPVTFDTVQELIQKGELSSAEASLLDSLLEQIGERPMAETGEVLAGELSPDQVARLRGQLQVRREQTAQHATPDAQLREYAPGPPKPELQEGPVLPLHGALMKDKLPEGGDA